MASHWVEEPGTHELGRWIHSEEPTINILTLAFSSWGDVCGSHMVEQLTGQPQVTDSGGALALFTVSPVINRFT